MTAAPGTARPALAQLRPAPGLLLASQLVFNIGFYAVVPFLALVMTQDFGMTATAVGVVLGARVFSQQGLFLAGGMITDRWGPRLAMLAGCLVRISGYATLAMAGSFPLFLLGAVLTGMGGALFSPALESLLGEAEERRRSTGRSAPALFALLAVCGEIGAVAGPLVGALLLGISFSWAALAGAAVFAVMAGVLWRNVPPRAPSPPRDRQDKLPPPPPRTEGIGVMLQKRRFVAFAALYSVNLLAYNQLYFGLPIELIRSGAGQAALAGLFAVASALTITLQLPVSRLTHRLGPGKALTLGFTINGLAFATMAVLAQYPATGALQLVPPLLLVSGLCLGRMCIGPVAMPLVLDFANGRPTGIYYGLLASMGGCAVLLGNLALGPLYSGATQPGPDAVWPWAVMAALLVIPAVGLSRLLPHRT